jgi:hypothetical protein
MQFVDNSGPTFVARLVPPLGPGGASVSLTLSEVIRSAYPTSRSPTYQPHQPHQPHQPRLPRQPPWFNKHTHHRKTSMVALPPTLPTANSDLGIIEKHMAQQPIMLHMFRMQTPIVHAETACCLLNNTFMI